MLTWQMGARCTLVYKCIHEEIFKIALKKKERKKKITASPPAAMTRCFYSILVCHLRARHHLGIQLHTSKYYLIWSTSPTSGIFPRCLKMRNRAGTGLHIIRIIWGSAVHMYHLHQWHPQLINGISCQRTTLKVTAEIKKRTKQQPPDWNDETVYLLEHSKWFG